MQLNIDEKKAIDAASEECGAYLEKIGKSDLAAMTGDEWLGFLGHVYTTIASEVRDQFDDDVPF